MRRFAYAIAVVAVWLLLLLWAAQVEWSSPISPQTRRVLTGSQFRAVFGTADPLQGRLHVGNAADDHSSLQSAQLSDVDAADFPTLRYRFEGFPRTLELSLIFRSADQPDDVQTVSLPWPGDGEATFDLSRVREWKGRILELGFAQFATPLLVPPELGFKPFNFVGAELWSPSWQGRVDALVTDWFGAWPWNQRSVHALGRESDTPTARSPIVVVALGASASGLLGALILGWRRRRLVIGAVICVGLGWITLDLRWQAGLWQRLQSTRALYGDEVWPVRERRVGDSDLVAAADELRTILRDEPANTRILVHAESSYAVLRLIWHLLPMNVGVYAGAAPMGASLPENTLLVFHDSDLWKRNAPLRALLAGSTRVTQSGSLHASGFEDSGWVIFRFHHVARLNGPGRAP